MWAVDFVAEAQGMLRPGWRRCRGETLGELHAELEHQVGGCRHRHVRVVLEEAAWVGGIVGGPGVVVAKYTQLL